MINPNRIHRSRAVIIQIGHGGMNFKVKLPRGHVISGWDLPRKFKVGDEVNIQAGFSICLDGYFVKTVNKIRNRVAA